MTTPGRVPTGGTRTGWREYATGIRSSASPWRSGTGATLSSRKGSFGVTGPQGNHGEDAKEYWFYLDSTPTHSYMKWAYKYPQAEFPYALLVAESQRRGKHDPEFELLDTGVFEGDRYFDVVVEYAKAAPEDILVRITAINRGPDRGTIHLLPTL